MQTHTATKRKAAAPLPMPEELLKPGKIADVVNIPQRTVLALDGQGEPEGARFQRSVGAMYNVAYTLKFARRASKRGDFRIGPLEARWWTDDPLVPIIAVPRSSWKWQLRLAVPEDVVDSEVAAAIAEVHRKKLDADEALRVRAASLPAQTVGRALHIGPYRNERRTFESIFAALADARVAPVARHMEVYLSDPRRAAPEKLKTVLCVETSGAISS